MTDEGEDGDEEAGGTRSKSQFQKFHDRLDERESSGGRSTERKEHETTSESDTESADSNREVDTSAPADETDGARAETSQLKGDAETPIETDTTDNETASVTENAQSETAGTLDNESDGWVWNVSGQEDRTDPSDSGGRIWNADEADRVRPDEASTEGVPEEQSEAPGANNADRWSKLKSSLGRERSSAIEESAASVEPLNEESPEPSRPTEEETPPSERSNEGEIPGGYLSDDLGRWTSASSVLLLGPAEHPVSDTICSRFLTDDGESRNVIFVTFNRSPSERIGICRRADGWSGGEIGIIEVGGESRNAPADSEITGGDRDGSITVRHVTNPGDLSKLGIVITQLLSAFEETPQETVLCFHTLSALHRQVGTKTLFRFLNTLQGRLNGTNAIGHYHMDPDLHDEIVIETLRPIFDSVVQFSADGEFNVE